MATTTDVLEARPKGEAAAFPFGLTVGIAAWRLGFAYQAGSAGLIGSKPLMVASSELLWSTR